MNLDKCNYVCDFAGRVMLWGLKKAREQDYAISNQHRV